MGDYYNKTRSPVAVTLLRGSSISISPKTWCFISPEDEGTASLAEAVRKGLLTRAIVPITVPDPASAALTPSLVPTVPVSTDASTAAPEASVVTPKQYRKNKSL